MKRRYQILSAIALGAALAAPQYAVTIRAVAATPPPSPPPIDRSAPTPPPLGPVPNKTGSGVSVPIALPKATPTPPSDKQEDDRKDLSGVWEVQIQRMNSDVVYDHFKLAQKGAVLTGQFLDNEHNNKLYPVAGSVDGKSIRLVVTKDDGSTLTFTGNVDNFTDMIGLLSAGSDSIAFTAAYRPKYKFIDSIAPLPSGIGNTSGGGGYNPP